jgi:hypothetical protein
MINNIELQRVVFKNNLTNTGLILEPVYVDIRIDLTAVVGYGHYVDAATGSIKLDITEVFIQGILTPIYIKMNYLDFNDLIQAS